MPPHDRPLSIVGSKPVTDKPKLAPKIREFQPLTGKFKAVKKRSQNVMPDFEFITTSGTQQYASRQVRSKARAHIMRKHHQKSNNLNAKAEDEEETPATNTKPQALCSTAKDSVVVSFNVFKTTDTPQGKISIFDSPSETSLMITETNNYSSMTISPQSLELLSHFIKTFVKAVIPLKPQHEHDLFTDVVSSPGCYHGALLVATAHLSVIKTNRIPVASLYHLGEAIRHVNLLLDDPEAQTQDTTITAVGCLAIFEAATNHESETSPIHFNGLEKLLKLRQSRKQPLNDGYLSNFIEGYCDTARGHMRCLVLTH